MSSSPFNPSVDIKLPSNQNSLYQGSVQVPQNTRSKPWNTILTTYADHKHAISRVMLVVFVIAYSIYFGFALAHDYDNAIDLIVLTSIVAILTVIVLLKNTAGKHIYKSWCKPCLAKLRNYRIANWVVAPLIVLVAVVYTCVDVIYSTGQLQALSGLVVFLCLPFIFSKHPAQIKLHPIVSGLSLQFLLAVLMIRHDFLYDAAKFLFEVTWSFREHAFYGAGQVFGDPFFLFHPYPMMYLPLVVFLCLLTSVLYFTGLLSIFISSVGWALRVIFGGTSVELTSILTGIIIGVTDTLLTYRPYLDLLTGSEFFTFLVGAHSGKATFASFLLIWSSVNPRHLIASAFLNAPAAFVMSKIHYPETSKSQLKTEEPLKDKKKGDYGLVQAGSNGAWFAGKIASTFIACSIFTISTQAFLDSSIEWMGERVGEEWTLQIATGRVFQPVAWLMGVPWHETELVGQVLGMKFFTDENQGLLILGEMRRKLMISERSSLIATYASQGTAGLGYMTVFAGVWTQLDKSGTMANKMISMIPSIMLCAHAASFFTGAMAGVFYTDSLAASHYMDNGNTFLRFLYADFPDYTNTIALL